MPVRILIVDDSRIVRGVLRAVLQHFPDLQVVGEAGDGKRAEQLVKELRPDVVTLDVLMPMMGGLETIAAIMADNPTRIVVVADLQDDQRIAAQALEAGAVAVFPKPARGFTAVEAQALAETLRQSTLMLLPRPQTTSLHRSQRPGPYRSALRMVGVVASTGGPRGLLALLQALPRSLSFSIAIVQHTTSGGAEPLAQWLARESRHEVTLARDGQLLAPGQVVIAPDGAHLLFANRQTVRLDHGPPLDSHRPSGTLLFKSLAAHFRGQAAGVVLSGMGYDGADGAAALEEVGGLVLVQDPATAAMSGMPSAALARSRAAVVETPDGIGKMLGRLAGKDAP